jgi:hypothetical protein
LWYNSVNPITLHSEFDVAGTTSLVSGHTPLHGETLPTVVIVLSFISSNGVLHGTEQQYFAKRNLNNNHNK